MKEFKEGDRVTYKGKTGIVGYVSLGTYPVFVVFDDGCTESFTLCGKFYEEDAHSSLFHTDDNRVMSVKMKGFNIGDIVVCNGNKGVVTFVDHDVRSYPVFVKFDNGGEESFTLDGKSLMNDDPPSLFHVDQTLFQTDVSIVGILNREGYGTLVDGDKVYVGREGVVVATLIMRGKG